MGVAVAAGGRGAKVAVGGSGVDVGGTGTVGVGGGVVGTGVDVGSGGEVGLGGVTGVEVKVGTKVLVGVSVAAGSGTSISRTEQPKSIVAASAMVRITRHFLAISLLSIPYFSHYRQVLGTAQVGIRAAHDTLPEVPALLPRLCPLSPSRAIP